MTSPMSIIRRVVPALTLSAVAALACTQLGCGSKQTMRSGTGVPASQGTISATEGANGNTDLTVQVQHLAPPSRVAADATVYVVWVKPRNAERQNVGALTLNDDLEGTLDTTTPHRQFQVMVTPEPSGQVAQPTNEPVFTTDVDRPQ